MRSPIGNLNSLKAQRDALSRRIEKLEKDNEIITNFAHKVMTEAKELGISKRDLALAIDPELDRNRSSKADKITDLITDSTKRAPRKVKCYTNPHNGEKIETKGGNHKGLKAWKDEYGAAVVETWAKYLQS